MQPIKKSEEQTKISQNKERMVVEISRRFHWPFRIMMLLLAWPLTPRVFEALMTGAVRNRWGNVHIYSENPTSFIITLIFWGTFLFIPLWFATFGTRVKKDDQEQDSEPK